MTNVADTDPRVIELLRRAARLHFLALVFECPQEGWQERLEPLAQEIGEADMLRLAEQARQEASPELYHTTFGPGGPAAAREVSYVETMLPGQLMADLQAFYQAFAFRPLAVEPPDHVAVELGFLAYLELKSAYAIANGDAQQAGIAADAAKRFAESHLSHFVAALSPLLETSGIGYLATAGDMLRQLDVFSLP